MRKRIHTLALLALVACGWLVAPQARPSDALFDAADYAGQVVVLDFWASWCGPCRKSFPWLNDMQEKYADQGLVIIGVNVDAERADADAFLAKYPGQFDIVYDAEGTLARQYDILGMPSSIIFDRDGQVATRHTGFREKQREQYENSLREQLAKAASPDARTAEEPQ